ncbi:MAG: hypothetical protein LLF81_11585 [Porphyromonadaceae bacterium]|nr:hypothetical protein [Porphyromonadaceae bacterium]
MEQKDYILREIEKIGIILNFIREKFFSSKSNLSKSIDDQLKDMKEMLLTEIGLDIDKFLSLNIEDSNEYICSFKGFNSENIELLAGCISQICLNENTIDSKKHLEMALQLYELCNLKSQTYSLERENKIMTIKNAL